MNTATKSWPGRRATGFTLIELLVVIAIIGLLVSLVFPVVSSVRENAKKAAARMDIKSIEIAVNDYYAEYRRLPFADAFHTDGRHTWRDMTEYCHNERLAIPGGGWHMSPDKYTDPEKGRLAICAIATLQGSNEFEGEPTGFNPRETPFLERQEGRPLGHFMDPWSQGFRLDAHPWNRQYDLIFDHNLNDLIDVAEFSRVIDDYLVQGKLVVVNCHGPNRKVEWNIRAMEYDDLYNVDVEALMERYNLKRDR